MSVIPGADSGGSAEAWPPASLAENDHILVWWLPEYDDALRQMVAQWQWAWTWRLSQRLQDLIAEDILQAWRQADPLCQQYAWYNVLHNFAIARSKQLGLIPRPAQRKACAICGTVFNEMDLGTLAERIGVDATDFCRECLTQAFQNGSTTASHEDVAAVLQALATALGRPPVTTDLKGRFDFATLSPSARSTAVRALMAKPTATRVKQLFGSWDAAVAHASATTLYELPTHAPHQPRQSGAATAGEFTSNEPERYLALRGPLPAVELEPERENWAYRGEISSFIGTGYLALAEAASLRLAAKDPYCNDLLAQIYGQTARFDEARAAFDKATRQINGTDTEYPTSDSEHTVDHLLVPRDVRTITAAPVFYQPIPNPPRGNMRFVFIGGHMEFVDRRGEHSCVTGVTPDGTLDSQLAENCARMNAMVDCEPWYRAAIATGTAIMAASSRLRAGVRPCGHIISYVTAPLRDVITALTGAPPTKVKEDAWSIRPVGKSGWSYARDAAHHVFNAQANYAYIGVEAPPTVSIWAWPDRSDLALQAFLDTISSPGDPITVILPDVPALRDFARRYVKGRPMTNVQRTLMEELHYRGGSMPNKRGVILSSDFLPSLVIHPDGREEAGNLLASALAYLDARHTLRLSVWDTLADPLLRDVVAEQPVSPQHCSLDDFARKDVVMWYKMWPDDDDPMVLLRPYRPSLVDQVPARERSG